MLALCLVIDTNMLVSAALKADGLQRTTFLLAITRPGRSYISTPVLEEYAEVLSRPELSIRRGLRLQLLQLIKNHGHLVAPSRRIEVTSDPDDNIFVECADAARADFLITGNRKHFPAFWKSTKIVTPREFVNLVAPHLIHLSSFQRTDNASPSQSTSTGEANPLEPFTPRRRLFLPLDLAQHPPQLGAQLACASPSPLHLPRIE